MLVQGESRDIEVYDEVLNKSSDCWGIHSSDVFTRPVVLNVCKILISSLNIRGGRFFKQSEIPI